VQEGEFNRRLRRSASFVASATALIVALALMAVADGGGGRFTTSPVRGPVPAPRVTPFEPPADETPTATPPSGRQPAKQQPPVLTPATVLAGAVRLVSAQPAQQPTPVSPLPPSAAPGAEPRPLPITPPVKATPTPPASAPETQCADRNGEKSDKAEKSKKPKKEKTVSRGRPAGAVPPARGRKVVRPSRSHGRHPHRDTRAMCRPRWDL
jgi:hypothetical protein